MSLERTNAMTIRKLGLVLLVLLTLVTVAHAQLEPTRIDSGLVRGVPLGDGLVVYRGIPYAAPPVGALRWRPPQPATAWDGVRNATEFGAACPQSALIALMSREPMPPTDEDCLFLNVWTAAPKADAGLPVLVWIHGGGLIGGWSHQRVYDGAALAGQGVVVVSLNYRLGPLGFFSHPALSAESKTGASGNYGLLDQIAALHWVQRNIAAFGGDPKQVTIFGESAGGTSVVTLCASPRARGLFRGAIAQSAWFSESNFSELRRDATKNPSAERRGLEMAKILLDEPGDEPLAVLRALPAELWKTLGQQYQPTIAIDGNLLEHSAEETFRRGEQNDVPLIIGTNADEGTAFNSVFPFRTVDAYREGISEFFGPFAGQILELYSVESDEQVADRLNHLITDSWFLRGTRAVLRGMAGVESPTWQYEFTRISPIMPALGAHHAAELGHVFGQLPAGVSPVDQELARTMQGYWLQFARTGDPNREGLPTWPPFEPESELHLVLDEKIRVAPAQRAETCDLLDRIHSAWNAGPTSDR